MAEWKPKLGSGPSGLERHEKHATTRPLWCLVVAAEPVRGGLLTAAARDAGWMTTICSDAASARAHAEQTLFRLAIIDLHRAESKGDSNAEAFRPLVEHLARSGDLLLAICSREGDAGLEIWARQLGAWLFLPGLPDAASLVEICAEALQLSWRISASSPRPEPSRTQSSRTSTERADSVAHHQAALRAVGRMRNVPVRRRDKPFGRRS